MSTLLHRIVDVVAHRSDEEMTGIHAWRIVAMVARLEPHRNRLVEMDGPRHPGGGDVAPVHVNTTVTTLRLSANPGPAFLRPALVHLRPKTIT